MAARPVLGRLDVRLVERIDAEDRARDRGRELPAEELGAEVVRIVEPHAPVLAVRPRLGILARRGHETFPVLAGRLGDQLLGPEAEAAGRLVDADLVPALAPALAELHPELEARVVVAEPAPLGHRLGPLEQRADLEVHQRRGHHAERRERGVAAADRRLAVDDPREVPLLAQAPRARCPGR